jgi:Family of unknown function (DUF6328)
MTLEQKIKDALDESRLLILGAQVLFGFQFNGIFQELFGDLSLPSRLFEVSGLTLLTLTVGLLIAPWMRHRIVERGKDSMPVLALATGFAGLALLPLSIGLAFDLFVAMDRIAGTLGGAIAGGAFFALAMLLWYALEFFLKKKSHPMPTDQSPQDTPLETRIDQLLTEARVIIPGVQAMLGFQLTVTLTRAFAELPAEAKVAHAVALCSMALAIILLMAPASLHRIAFAGEDDPEFLRIASLFVTLAPLPLAFGIALDTYVAAGRALQPAAAAALAFLAIIVLLGLWYAYPLWRRWRRRKPA